jgi:streptomycin 6-kinase
MRPAGEPGALERTAREIAAEWGLELGRPFALSRWSYVAPVGADAVLKVRSADDDESDQEADALAFWDGEAAVRLLRHDREQRALLIERANPGIDLSQLPDEEATARATEIGRRLWRPASRPFRWLGDHVPRWADNADQDGLGVPELIPLARRLYGSMEVGRQRLVHGDFHHHNLLSSGRGPLAIDPKPMLGEPEYDIASFLWNPLNSAMTVERTERRLQAFAAAGLDDGRMRAWAVIRGAYLAGQDEAQVLRGLV